MADSADPGVVGFVGTGAMGGAMVERLLSAGRAVQVHNRTRANAAALERLGATWADTPAGLARECPLVLGCLRDTRAVESVYLGPDGLVEGAGPGHVFVEHATFAPAAADRIAADCEQRGAAFLDIPVTGGPEGARTGTLIGMAGGRLEALRAATPVLEAYLAEVHHIGPTGQGLRLKLANQLLVGAHVAVAAEVAGLLRRLAIPFESAAPVLTRGWAGSAMLERTLARLATGELRGTGATLAGLLEVQPLIEEVARDLEVDVPVFTAARGVLGEAVDAGLTQLDPAGLAAVRGVRIDPPRR